MKRETAAKLWVLGVVVLIGLELRGVVNAGRLIDRLGKALEVGTAGLLFVYGNQLDKLPWGKDQKAKAKDDSEKPN